ncbi:MAG: cysteine--tRNA ligase [Solirubrobacterales bacterium]
MIRVYNTQKRQKEELHTVAPNQVKMYVCGPTVYNYIHLGNARPLVAFDVIRRYLSFRGYAVTYIQNFTDVDDKIINRAREQGDDPVAMAARYIEEYFKDADALGVRRADLHPKVSEHIPEIINMVQGLIDRGHAYAVDGDVYFRVASFADYGKLSGRSIDEMLSGARVEVDERKEAPVDFALWKAAKPGEPSWDSPWGPGRPGWHIECSAMSAKYLGETFDIHGGGADLVFPHHENELAQSEAFTGKPFVNYWLHNGFITVNKEKMSKSLGNFFIVRDILDNFPAPVVRFYLAATHYRSPLDFDDTKLEEAGRALERLRTARTLLKEALDQYKINADPAESIEELLAKVDEYARNSPLANQAASLFASFTAVVAEVRARFIEAMDDDFNTAQAVGHLFDLAREINSYIQSFGPMRNQIVHGTEGHIRSSMLSINWMMLNRAAQTFDELAAVLGISLENRADLTGVLWNVLEAAVKIREGVRKNKDFATSDRIRDLLSQRGAVLEDSKEGTRIRLNGQPELNEIMDDLIMVRKELRAQKNFTGADLLRDQLAAAGVVLEDTKEGCRWKISAN